MSAALRTDSLSIRSISIASPSCPASMIFSTVVSSPPGTGVTPSSSRALPSVKVRADTATSKPA